MHFLQNPTKYKNHIQKEMIYYKINDETDKSVNNCRIKLTKWCLGRMINPVFGPLQVQMSAALWSKMSSETVCHLES